MIMRASYVSQRWSHLGQDAASTGRGIFDQIPTLIVGRKNYPPDGARSEQFTFLWRNLPKIVKLRSEMRM
jgi:hypothetical protein